MKNFIDNVDFYELPAQKYWQPPASWSAEKKKDETQSAIFSGNYIGARKMDGAFYKFIKDEDGNMQLIGRSRSVSGEYLDKIAWVPQLHNFFNALPNGTCVIGEIYFPNNEGSNHVTTIMGCLQAKALDRQETGDKLHYYIFDVLAWNNKNLYKENIENRIGYLTELLHYSETIKNNYIEIAKYYEGEELWNKLQEILADGGEGVVITKKGTCYQPGKRGAKQTIKVKKELQQTIDAVILKANAPTRLYTGKDILNWKLWENTKTGEKLKGELYKDYSDGLAIEPVTKNYFNGWAGSFIIGMYNPETDKYKPIGSLSGLTEEVLSNPSYYIGKVVEVTGMQIFKDEQGNFSGIRHPKLVQFRSDKSPKECLMEQLL